ncbi:MAG: outer membrane lipoprotein-sorting protein [Myxococcota bacterium]|nr:outer membrane lipoprotein-sorting protein [Myxococcota bacterium]
MPLKRLRISFWLYILALAAPLVAGAQSPSTPVSVAQTEPGSTTGRQIMEWVHDRDDGDYGISDLEMVLIDKRGNERIRSMRSFARDQGDDDLSLIFFLSPADVKNTGFLNHDYDDADHDDDQWLYLPALKKTKRIAGGDKSGSFMGSDFSYADMSSPPLDRYTYTLMKETEVDGIPVWQVEAVPNAKQSKQTGYTKSIHFVRKDNYVVIRSVSWLKKGKRLKYMTVDKLEQIDGIWVPTQITMSTRKGKKTLHKTRLQVSNVMFNQPLADDTFTVRRLEKGI